MKKTLRLLSIAAMLLLLAVSCKKEEEPNNVFPWLCFTAQERNSSVSMEVNVQPSQTVILPKLETSTDGIHWKTFTPGETTITLKQITDKVYFRGDNPSGFSIRNGINFKMSGKISASGNIMSLLDPTCQMMEIPSKGCFSYLFSGCVSLITAPELPATTLTDECYKYMFFGCTNLTKAPELPATTLAIACYEDMFYECTSLTTAPELPATNLADDCYADMFRTCTNLTIAPELPATTLAKHCYSGMFKECSSLTTAPKLPATTLANSCYKAMFYGCSNLKTAPKLPATILPDYCYNYMFSFCTSLNEIEVHFSDWKDYNDSTIEWFLGMNTTGTFRCPSNLPQIFGISNIPEGWNVETF